MLKSVLCAALLIVGTATAASAEDADSPIRYVQTADLNLASAHGVATLDRRIGTAITNICGPNERELDQISEQQACRAHARASVAGQKSALLAAARVDRTMRIAAR